jgi:hypothetical protein
MAEVIIRLVDEHAELALRARMRADAEHARTNVEDLAEVQRVQAELDELSDGAPGRSRLPGVAGPGL